MLRFLHSIFGGHEQDKYPESLVHEAIERAVDATDTQVRAVSGYKKKLRPAVVRAIEHVVGLVNALPAPTPIHLAAYTNDFRLKRFFISQAHLKKVVEGDRALADFLRGPQGGASEVFALLAMEKQEKGIFGSALSGEVVIHDVPQVTVSFDGHRFLDPSGEERETRRLLMRRAYDHLLSLALRRLTEVKWEREELERRQALLQAKLNLLEREGWSFMTGAGSEGMDAAGVEKQLEQLEGQLQELGGEDKVFETYLEVVGEVLGRPEEYLRERSETIFVDRMGIKRSEAAEDAPALQLVEVFNAEGRSLVVTLISFTGDELRGLIS
jgi:hypothetical protein